MENMIDISNVNILLDNKYQVSLPYEIYNELYRVEIPKYKRREFKIDMQFNSNEKVTFSDKNNNQLITKRKY